MRSSLSSIAASAERVRRAALPDRGEQHVGLDAEDGAVRSELAFVLVGVLEHAPLNTPAWPSSATGRAQERMTTPLVCASSRSNRLAFIFSEPRR